jgi:hypothetical protein
MILWTLYRAAQTVYDISHMISNYRYYLVVGYSVGTLLRMGVDTVTGWL